LIAGLAPFSFSLSVLACRQELIITIMIDNSGRPTNHKKKKDRRIVTSRAKVDDEESIQLYRLTCGGVDGPRNSVVWSSFFIGHVFMADALLSCGRPSSSRNNTEDMGKMSHLCPAWPVWPITFFCGRSQPAIWRFICRRIKPGRSLLVAVGGGGGENKGRAPIKAAAVQGRRQTDKFCSVWV
jgi:hypothetical protein